MFFHRGGPHDFACATCHGSDKQHSLLQDLPNLTKTELAQRAYTSWPAYRVSQGELRSFNGVCSIASASSVSRNSTSPRKGRSC